METIVEGAGPKTIVMIHGWPDTHRLWDGAVAALKDRYRCVRFTLPGFDRPAVHSLDELLRFIHSAVGGKRVTLLVHDWGCFLGYQFAMRHPELVERIIGVDIGDTGSRSPGGWTATPWQEGWRASCAIRWIRTGCVRAWATCTRCAGSASPAG